MRIVEHRLPDGVPLERGAALGRAGREDVRDGVGRYLAHYALAGVPEATARRVARASAEALAAWAPDLAAEAEGTAKGAGVDPAELALLYARTEILATLPREAPECSAVVVLPPDGPPRTLQTWDWVADVAPVGWILRGTGPDGLGFATFTEPGMPGKIGVNAAGVGCHFNILRHESDATGADGVPVHAVARRVLDTATTLDEAIEVARSATVSASTVLTVATVDGQAAALELSPAGVGVVRPEDGVLLHTNHFLDPVLATGEACDAGSTTYARLEHLRAQRPALRAAGEQGARPLARAACGDAGAGAPICAVPSATAGPTERWETLLTVSLDLAGPAVVGLPGSPAVLETTAPTRWALN
ncbi:C45 family peptidase [Nocardioides sp. KR10-350]|uniref:C45 family peptidase n=1 Tax=Nocardioides cheoyonin TaxID=3156615 RepID=UPI0032B35553